MKDLAGLVADQRTFFNSGRTKDISFRIDALKRLAIAIESNEKSLFDALDRDFRKPAVETFISEIGFVTREIAFMLRHLRSWMRPKRARTNLFNLPGRSRVYAEPYGVALIIGPWNYPLHLTLVPLIAAIAAGNCAVVKPSEISCATSAAVTRIVNETFDAAHVLSVQGGKEESEQLLAKQFDKIFFTGSAAVGRVVMQAAARHLTPVTLELGGKSPAIVDSDADLAVAARRIAWGKYINAGQTCVAPDYLLVHHRVMDAFLVDLGRTIRTFFGNDPAKSPDYARIINDRHFDRLVGYLRDGKSIIGGETDRADRYIAPTVLVNASWDAPVMQEEIFGPILPVLAFDDLDDAIAMINKRNPCPLALYYFSRSRSGRERIIQDVPFGGGAMNDTVLHMTNPHLPFGGIGPSGFGSYHGKAGFDAFSHTKSIMRRATWFDLPLRYPPSAGKLRWLRTVIGWDR